LTDLKNGKLQLLNMINCIFVKKCYEVGIFTRTRKAALKSVSLQVEHNQVFGIIGLNGAGKSTLLKILMGFIRQDSGEALINGTPADKPDNHQLIGYLPEHPSLYPNLSLTEHLEFGCRVGNLTGQRKNTRIQQVLETVDLIDSAKIPIKRFSKGMTQRAALAYAILLEPEILILDEPMSGLDPLGRQLVIDIIREYQQKGTTILFCSHILTDVERICDRIGIMHQGSLVTIVTTPINEIESNNFAHTGTGKTPLEALFLHTVQA